MDPTKPNLGLTTWKGSPHAAIRRADVSVAKNYLSKDELTQLERIVGMYLDYAEDQARRKRPMHMHDGAEKLDAFLRFNERDILVHVGKASHAVAEKLAQDAYDMGAIAWLDGQNGTRMYESFLPLWQTFVDAQSWKPNLERSVAIFADEMRALREFRAKAEIGS